MIIGGLITREAHDIADILFGSAVVVDPKEVYIVPGVAFLSILIHWVFFKDFIFVSFDPETARLFNYPVKDTEYGSITYDWSCNSCHNPRPGGTACFCFSGSSSAYRSFLN